MVLGFLNVTTITNTRWNITSIHPLLTIGPGQLQQLRVSLEPRTLFQYHGILSVHKFPLYIKIRWSHDHLIFIIGIHVPGKMVFCVEKEACGTGLFFNTNTIFPVTVSLLPFSSGPGPSVLCGSQLAPVSCGWCVLCLQATHHTALPSAAIHCPTAGLLQWSAGSKQGGCLIYDPLGQPLNGFTMHPWQVSAEDRCLVATTLYTWGMC